MLQSEMKFFAPSALCGCIMCEHISLHDVKLCSLLSTREGRKGYSLIPHDNDHDDHDHTSKTLFMPCWLQVAG